MTDELKPSPEAVLQPCPIPWCSSNTAPSWGNNRLAMPVRGGGWHVVCPFCGTKGPTCKTKTEAEDVWNTRPLRTAKTTKHPEIKEGKW